MLIRLITPLFLLLFFLNLFATSSLAEDQASPTATATTIPYESVNPPDGFSYVIKRVKERVGTFFAFSNEAKVKNYQNLADVRLAELKYVVDNKKQAYFEKSTQRYFTSVGELTEFVKSKNLKTNSESIKKNLNSQIPILNTLRDQYEFGTAEWRFLEDDINYIKGYINDLPS